MSEKISAMPAAADIANADILPIVQSAINKSITRQRLLVAKSGESITVEGADTTRINIDPTGQLLVVLNGGSGRILVTDLAHSFLTIDPTSGAFQFAAPPGSAIAVLGSGSSIGIDTGGNIEIVPASGQHAELTNTVGATLQVDSSGNITIATSGSGILSITGGGAQILTDNLGNMALTPGGGGQLKMQYTPGAPGNWSPQPVAYQDAVDRLAAAVAGLLGTPIP